MLEFPRQGCEIQKKGPSRILREGPSITRQYLLSHLQYYHRLEVLNFCVRDGNRCDHFDMVAGRELAGLFALPALSLRLTLSGPEKQGRTRLD